jgi:membrane protease YdiL (CAAX protease family)
VLDQPRRGWSAVQTRLLIYASIALIVIVATAPLVGSELPWTGLPALLGGIAGAWVARRLDHAPLGIGLPIRVRLPAQVGLGLGLGILVASVVVIAIALAGGVRWFAEGGTTRAWLDTGGHALWLLFIPALAEEVVVRGYPLRALAEAKGPAWALAITSIGFAALHLANPSITPVALVNLAAAGLFLGVLALRTGSLWWCAGAHLGWNWALGFLFDLPVSGIETVDSPLIGATERGPFWLSGGPFGPEGSIVAVIVLVGAAAWVWRTRPRDGTANILRDRARRDRSDSDPEATEDA